MAQNIIFNSLKDSLYSIRRNKSLFILLCVMQIIFLISFFYITSIYIPRIYESSKKIIDYLQQQKIDESSVDINILKQKNILGDDPLSISRNFNDAVKNFRFYLLYTFILLTFSISLFWGITTKLTHGHNIRRMIKVTRKIFVIAFFYLGLIFLFFFSITNISFFSVAEGAQRILIKYLSFLLLSPTLIYFMYVSIALSNKNELKNIVQRTLYFGIKDVHYVLSVYFVNLCLLAISIASIIYFVENFYFLMLSLVFLVLILIFGRIFMINVVDRLGDKG